MPRPAGRAHWMTTRSASAVGPRGGRAAAALAARGLVGRTDPPHGAEPRGGGDRRAATSCSIDDLKE